MTEKLTPIAVKDAREGDIIVATHSDGSIIRGKVKRNNAGTTLYLSAPAAARLDITLALSNLVFHGYTLQRAEPPAPPIPTEPGLYESSRYPGANPYLLTKEGKWHELGLRSGHLYSETRYPSALGTLTRLVPAGVTK